MLKTRNKVTFILACILMTLMLAGLIFTVSLEIGYLEVRAERDALESDPNYDPDVGESFGLGLSEGLSAALSLLFAVIGAILGAGATLFSALTIPARAKWLKITAVVFTAVAVACTLFMFPGVLFIVRDNLA